MAEDSKPLRPKPKNNEVLVFSAREMCQPVDAPANPSDSPGIFVVLEQLERESRLGSLVNVKVARLL